jgi:hypothetical protein
MAAITEKTDACVKSEFKGAACFRKVKYFNIKKALEEQNFKEEDVDAIMTTIRNVLKFDPDANTYTQGAKKSIYKYKAKLAAAKE